MKFEDFAKLKNIKLNKEITIYCCHDCCFKVNDRYNLTQEEYFDNIDRNIDHSSILKVDLV